MAMYIERGGTLDGRWGAVFMWWAERTILHHFHQEAMQMGMDEEAETLLRVAGANDNVADILFKDVWTGTPRTVPALANRG